MEREFKINSTLETCIREAFSGHSTFKTRKSMNPFLRDAVASYLDNHAYVPEFELRYAWRSYREGANITIRQTSFRDPRGEYIATGLDNPSLKNTRKFKHASFGEMASKIIGAKHPGAILAFSSKKTRENPALHTSSLIYYKDEKVALVALGEMLSPEPTEMRVTYEIINPPAKK